MLRPYYPLIIYQNHLPLLYLSYVHIPVLYSVYIYSLKVPETYEECRRPFRRAYEWVEVRATYCPYVGKLSLKADKPQDDQ